MDLQTAIDITKKVWGLSPCGDDKDQDLGRPKALDSYDDNNFYMVGPSLPPSLPCLLLIPCSFTPFSYLQPGTLPGQAQAKKYLLKVHNGVESSNLPFLDFQSQMMATLHG